MSQAAGAGLLLASTSPRRADLLAEAGIPFEVVAPGLDDGGEATLVRDALVRGLPAVSIVGRLAVAKLLATLDAVEPGRAILTADTTVALDGDLLGKPADRQEAGVLLRRLSGTTHSVYTGVALLTESGRLVVGVETSMVGFTVFGEDVLQAYLEKDLWRGKAGAYGVQDAAAAPLIREVEGSTSNVKGLPLELLSRMLASP